MIVFTCNHCPFAKLYPERFNALNSKYQSLGVPLIAINSMDSAIYDEERFELMQEKSKSENFNFHYLQDGQQKVGKEFNAKHTPHAFVIWKESGSWVIKYSGAIDDNGEHPELAILPIFQMMWMNCCKINQSPSQKRNLLGVRFSIESKCMIRLFLVVTIMKISIDTIWRIQSK